MNVFRLSGDLLHLASIVLLVWKMRRSKSCAGISLKTQALYLAVFVSRYVDVGWHFVSAYNTLMKLFFVGSSAYVVWLMARPLRATYDPALDTFRTEYLAGGSALAALLFHYDLSPAELLWAFSIFLEAVAILPQLFMLQRTGEAETITTHYLFALGAYRACYLLNWIYRYHYESHYDIIAWVAGTVQTALYADFFYIYFTR